MLPQLGDSQPGGPQSAGGPQPGGSGPPIIINPAESLLKAGGNAAFLEEHPPDGELLPFFELLLIAQPLLSAAAHRLEIRSAY